MTYKFLNTLKGRFVVYAEAVNGDAYISLHKCDNLNDEEAKSYFHREHKMEVLELIRQKQKNTIQHAES